MYMPRSEAGDLCKIAGISGFAFQGTNAHALLSRSDARDY